MHRCFLSVTKQRPLLPQDSASKSAFLRGGCPSPELWPWANLAVHTARLPETLHYREDTRMTDKQENCQASSSVTASGEFSTLSLVLRSGHEGAFSTCSWKHQPWSWRWSLALGRGLAAQHAAGRPPNLVFICLHWICPLWASSICVKRYWFSTHGCASYNKFKLKG